MYENNLVRGIIHGEDTEVDTLMCGVDYGGTVSVIEQQGRFALWRKSAGTYWRAKFSTRGYAPVEYWLVELVEDETKMVEIRQKFYKRRFIKARIIKKIEPGKKRSLIEELRKELYQLAS